MNTIPNDERIRQALELMNDYGPIDGSHHKAWVIDQVVRILADDYEEFVKNHNDGEDGPETYEWDEGIPP